MERVATLRLVVPEERVSPSDQQMLSPSQVAKRLNISPHTVHEEIRAGHLHAHRFGTKCIRISTAQLEEYVASREI